MSNELAIIIAAGITVGGSVLIFALNSLFNFFANTRARKERFFYEVFPKRIEFYQELSAAMTKFSYEYPALDFDSLIAFDEFIEELGIQLVDFLNRGVLIASKDVCKYIADLHRIVSATKIINNALLLGKDSGNSDNTAEKLKKSLLTLSQPHYQNILAQIRIETGQEVVDNYCFNLNKKDIKRLRKLYKKMEQNQ
ncbi:hypothetical protein [Treponema phagedenis]|uniref:hypothetical protein n=1 Tax=Treponema phagedenis TaxID=162 RepID=UPI0019817F70|nr:hypothetical protein [Treponema phagedenis]QSH95085.1 hypothetical protein C5O78_08550 [Treponema phagedenis]